MGPAPRRRIHCPKCRALGLDTDCTDSIPYARRKNSMNPYGDDGDELLVTVSFAVPVSGEDREYMRDHATRFRDELTDDPQQLLDLIRGLDDYDLQVKPFSET